MLFHATALFLSTMVLQNVASGVHVWKAAELKTRAGVLSQKLSEQKVASETLATEGNRSFMLAHREGPGLAEWHETQADVMFILSGDVTIVYGGTIVDAKTTTQGEMRGPSIRDGIEVKLGPGDVLHIPAKTPHQMRLEAGKQVTYFVTKVTE